MSGLRPATTSNLELLDLPGSDLDFTGSQPADHGVSDRNPSDRDSADRRCADRR
jgi:hypothetical protein